MDYTLRPITEDEYEAFLRCFVKAFGRDYDAEEAKLERDLIELPRTLAAFDARDGLVGTALVYRRQLSVPGGVVPAGHVSLVSVLGTHRRRGILRRLMTRQLNDLRAAGEPVALLWASEEAIYGRFGYGPATATIDYDAHNRELYIPPGPESGRLREVELAEAGETLAAVYEAVWRDRPGHSSRGPALWRAMTADLEPSRNGASAMRVILHETDGGRGPGSRPEVPSPGREASRESGPAESGIEGVGTPVCDGYALFRMRHERNPSGPGRIVEVQEVIAPDLDAYWQLWRYLFTVDLSRRVKYGFAASDEPLRYLVTEPRRLTERLGTGLWLRIVDLPAALAARRYVAAADVVLDVRDDLLAGNAGRWRLRTGEGVCERTEAPADLELGIAELGAAYLGGTPLAALAGAGRVRELRPGALAEASTAFGWHRAPNGIEIF
jgi:predicted acetyltransferase